MKNKIINEDNLKIKKIVNKILKEHISNSQIVSEQSIVPIITKLLGSRIVQKLESSKGDDVIRELESLFVKAERNVAMDAGKIALKSATGTPIKMSQIQNGIELVLDGSHTPDEVAQYFPTNLVDGTNFRSQLLSLLKKQKPVSRITPKFTIPSINKEFEKLSLVDEVEVEGRLKNLFPDGPLRDIKKMVNNLKIANPKTQQEFDKAYMEAVSGYEPKYRKILSEPSIMQKSKDLYKGLGKYGKRFFWLLTIPGGYVVLKNLGVPVENLTGWVVDEWKNIITDQMKGVQRKLNSPNETPSPENNKQRRKANF